MGAAVFNRCLHEFAQAVALATGENTVEVVINSNGGDVLASATKTVYFDAGLSTSARRLLYVDVVPGDSEVPNLDGTVVIDIDDDVILGFLGQQHVRGMSPDGTEIYMDDNSVIGTMFHDTLRTLPFSENIALNGFLVSPQGDYLFSGDEVIDVQSNALESSLLPRSIVTGSSYESASIPGGPAITSDGTTVFAQNAIFAIDVATQTETDTEATGNFLSDISVSPNDLRLLVSEYSGGGRLDVYDIENDQSISISKTINGLGDFSGEIGWLGDDLLVIGSSGNPATRGGGLFLVNLEQEESVDPDFFREIPLADNLTSSIEDHQVFISTGGDETGTRYGVDVWMMSDDLELERVKTFLIGVNRFETGLGTPDNDQIRRIIFKPAIELSGALSVDVAEYEFAAFDNFSSSTETSQEPWLPNLVGTDGLPIEENGDITRPPWNLKNSSLLQLSEGILGTQLPRADFHNVIEYGQSGETGYRQLNRVDLFFLRLGTELNSEVDREEMLGLPADDFLGEPNLASIDQICEGWQENKIDSIIRYQSAPKSNRSSAFEFVES